MIDVIALNKAVPRIVHSTDSHVPLPRYNLTLSFLVTVFSFAGYSTHCDATFLHTGHE